ncbi:MAG: carboxypeptidase-like regulatory domain-containing protein, partial [Dysgonamonadaceae bacterium]|nr:carboxypeptidase-like regulatory domain-containing protein [Dysgonamonadaceae bacterium]
MKHLLFILFFLFFAMNIHAQTVSGTVSDEKGETLIGVNVTVKGTSVGTVTDLSGVFTIHAAENATLVFSYVGMKPVEEAVNNRKTINIVMTANSSDLDELVVIGYGSVKKRDLTGAVSSVKASDMELTSVAS